MIDGSLLKAAFLARFEMEGYEFVKHPSTECVRLALRDFFRNGGTKENAKEYFGPFAGCANTATPDKRFGDTLLDRRVVIHSTRYGNDEIDFAITCLFTVGNDLITVALPHHNGIGDPEYARRLRHDGQPATIRQVRLGGFVIA
ncbi:hypothetical protein [Blastopirellula marina]|uniref:hypothetical protein n=1 Tax=Blastopirellula marina TaxID=124 RepID=UPI00032623C2|nr:hypothetical protein [Blastopirellula marina]